ncbi:MAG: hypothetical protein HY033_12195 [Ignavibacteriae bacterium]|nr:hypothetical protein [Ignavibacteria bacterium]MBI3365653.1 hypothetical protein [Ignavibacteriota bacterium]
MEIEKNLGVPADWKPEKGQTLTSEQVFALTVRRSLFGRLARVFKSTGFDKEAALNLINLIGNIRYLLSTAAIEAFIEGRKEVQEWIAQGYREGKITLSAEVQKQFKQFLSKTDQFRHQVVKHLAKKFPEKRISPHKLHALPKDIRKAGRDFLHRQFGNSLQANNIIKEVFRKPRKPRTQRVNEPFRNASQFTPHG